MMINDVVFEGFHGEDILKRACMYSFLSDGGPKKDQLMLDASISLYFIFRRYGLTANPRLQIDVQQCSLENQKGSIAIDIAQE